MPPFNVIGQHFLYKGGQTILFVWRQVFDDAEIEIRRSPGMSEASERVV